jgi:hypothetical protein
MFTCKLELPLCREWKYFNYEPKTVRFACEVGSLEGKDVVSGIKLPQFSSAAVPKVHGKKNIFFSSSSLRCRGRKGLGGDSVLFLFIQTNTFEFNQKRNCSTN